MAKFFKFIGFLIILIIILSFASCTVGLFTMMNPESKLHSKALLHLKLEGVILDGEKFLKDLKKYRELDQIKGIIIQVNSPGGVVGPSQEIYSELKKTREIYKKPVYVSGLGVMASGAYYAAVGADKIYVNPGTLVGSIGVIMEFANLQKLYEWAKIKRYAITTGDYKDTGAEYREMREDERKLVKEMMAEVLDQFKKAIADGRKMTVDKITPHADGRIFTGEKAVSLKLADEVGTFTDAIQALGKATGLGDNPELFEPPKERDDFLEYFLSQEARSESDLGKTLKTYLKLQGQPLFLMPGAFVE